MARPSSFIGTAGWSIPRSSAARFPADGSHLERYARVLPAVEINSTFYRRHAPAVFARWRDAVPAAFRFSVKAPKTLTHENRLRSVAGLADFLSDAKELGARLGPLLFQLPPSLAFEKTAARRFFAALRRRHKGAVVCEPRNATWFSPAAKRLLIQLRVARAAADPAVVPEAAKPGGWRGLRYWRLHGSPKKYISTYSAGALRDLAAGVAKSRAPAWVIFDNTMLGGATENALALRALLSADR